MRDVMERCEYCGEKHEKLMLGSRLKLVGGIFLLVLLLSFHPLLAPLNESLLSYLELIWWAVLLGLFLGGLIDYFIPEEFIFKYLGQKKPISILYAVIAGFLMSACSHGILAISMQLYKKGAGIPAVVTFLLAAPWANLTITILLFSFFGLKAFFFILAAIIIALITGFVYMLAERAGLIEKSRDIRFAGRYDWDRIRRFDMRHSISGVVRGSMNLANMVLWWIIIGVSLAAVIGAYVPGHLFLDYLGPGLIGLILTLLFATVIEVCSEGSSPIAFEIFNKVGVLGNPFVFLMAGVVTDYTEIGLIWTNIGRRSAILLPLVTVPLVLLAGILFNMYL